MKSSGTAGGLSRKFCELLKPGGENNGNHTVAVITELVSLSPVIISRVYQGPHGSPLQYDKGLKVGRLGGRGLGGLLRVREFAVSFRGPGARL